jgi:hypothetical protein
MRQIRAQKQNGLSVILILLTVRLQKAHGLQVRTDGQNVRTPLRN